MESQFPDDENGDVLRRLQSKDDDLSIPRDIDYSVIFDQESGATQFAEHFCGLGYAASVELVRPDGDYPWDVVVVKHMVPSHAAIGEFEVLLESVCGPLGGRNDGWGCLTHVSNGNLIQGQ